MIAITKMKPLSYLMVLGIFVSACTPPQQTAVPAGGEKIMDEWVACLFLDFFEENGGKTVIPNTAISKSFSACSTEEKKFYNFVYTQSGQSKSTAQTAVNQGREIAKKEIFKVLAAANS
jgi:hypothetical protein